MDDCFGWHDIQVDLLTLPTLPCFSTSPLSPSSSPHGREAEASEAIRGRRQQLCEVGDERAPTVHDDEGGEDEGGNGTGELEVIAQRWARPMVFLTSPPNSPTHPTAPQFSAWKIRWRTQLLRRSDTQTMHHETVSFPTSCVFRAAHASEALYRPAPCFDHFTLSVYLLLISVSKDLADRFRDPFYISHVYSMDDLTTDCTIAVSLLAFARSG